MAEFRQTGCGDRNHLPDSTNLWALRQAGAVKLSLFLTDSFFFIVFNVKLMQ